MLDSGFGLQHLQDAVFDPFPMLIGSALDPIDLRSVLALFRLHRAIAPGDSTSSVHWQDDSTRPLKAGGPSQDCLVQYIRWQYRARMRASLWFARTHD